MNGEANAVPGSALESQTVVTAPLSSTRPLYWSIRRELWENRAIYLAPLVAAAVILFGFLISTVNLPQHVRNLPALDPAAQRSVITMPYNAAAFLMVLTAFIVSVFFCLDALHGERRDRSILFWKSLPVSDLTTVLSKVSIPMLVLPLIIFPIIVVMHLVMLLWSTVLLDVSGVGAGALWANVNPGEFWVALLYGLVAISLWYAPIYAWLILVSVWARRPFLWATLPLFLISVLEKLAFNTGHFAALIGYRFMGWYTESFTMLPRGAAPLHPLAQLTPIRFLATPGLWIGLLFASALLFGAARLRRYRGPI